MKNEWGIPTRTYVKTVYDTKRIVSRADKLVPLVINKTKWLCHPLKLIDKGNQQPHKASCTKPNHMEKPVNTWLNKGIIDYLKIELSNNNGLDCDTETQ